MINTVKNQADIDNPMTITGYFVDGIKNVPVSQSNKDYREVQAWIADGNTPEDAYTQQEIDDANVEITYQELKTQLQNLTIDFMGHTFSGSQEQQNFVVAMLTKIEGEIPQATRNIYAIDGRTKVPMTKTNMLDFMTAVDIAQEAITNI